MWVPLPAPQEWWQCCDACPVLGFPCAHQQVCMGVHGPAAKREVSREQRCLHVKGGGVWAAQKIHPRHQVVIRERGGGRARSGVCEEPGMKGRSNYRARGRQEKR